MVNTQKMAVIFLVLAIVLAVTAVVLNVTLDKTQSVSGVKTAGQVVQGDQTGNVKIVVNSPASGATS